MSELALVKKPQRSRAFRPAPELTPIDVGEFYSTGRLRRSIRSAQCSLPGHARRLGVDKTDLRTKLIQCAHWGLVTRRSLGMRTSVIELTDTGRASLFWAAPPRPPDTEENRWANEVAQGIAAVYWVGVRDVITGRAGLGQARLCYALTEAHWSMGRIALYFGLTFDSVRDAVLRWVEHAASMMGPDELVE